MDLESAGLDALTDREPPRGLLPSRPPELLAPGPAQLAALIDHTRLEANATAQDIERLCDEALRHGFANVCVNGHHVRRAVERLAGSRVGVASVVGFPLGASAPGAKQREAVLALGEGARELDMVLNIGAFLAGDHALAAREIEDVAVAAGSHGALLKVILETGFLLPDQLRQACRLCADSGADFVKSCTGFGPRGVSLEDVALMRAAVGERLGIKASGGVRSAAFARELLAAGATRLGSSASVDIVREA